MNSDVLTLPVVMLGLAILLALLIERLLEVARSIADYYEVRYGDTRKWTRKAEQIRSNIELRLDTAKAGDQQEFSVVMGLLTWYVHRSTPDEHGAFVISADKIRKLTLRVRYKAYAVVLGIACAWLLDIDVVELVKAAQTLAGNLSAEVRYEPHWHGVLMAGIAMGLGAGPMHKIITALENARKGRVEVGSEK
jgi:hypothetical protein